MFEKEYWNIKAQTHGHTGHAEPFYYCFDQQARLFAIDELIKNSNSKKETALDFGCGSGDFIDILNKHYKTIYAFDISEVVVKLAKKNFNESKITISDNFNQISSNKPFDLILTVTVLQTIKKEELESTIQTLKELLSENGSLICMEFFRNEELTGEENQMKATINEWKNILASNKLKIISEHNFYNPIIEPTKSWYYYNTKLYLKILKLFKYTNFAQTKFAQVSKKIIAQHKDVILNKETAFKIYTIQKENSCN